MSERVSELLSGLLSVKPEMNAYPSIRLLSNCTIGSERVAVAVAAGVDTAISSLACRARGSLRRASSGTLREEELT